MNIRIYPKSLLETVWQQDKLLFTPEAEQPVSYTHLVSISGCSGGADGNGV